MQLILWCRIFGFTGIVRTDCNQTEELLTHHNLEWPIYVNPISLLILFWLSATEVSRQLFSDLKVGIYIYVSGTFDVTLFGVVYSQNKLVTVRKKHWTIKQRASFHQ